MAEKKANEEKDEQARQAAAANEPVIDVLTSRKHVNPEKEILKIREDLINHAVLLERARTARKTVEEERDYLRRQVR